MSPRRRPAPLWKRRFLVAIALFAFALIVRGVNLEIVKTNPYFDAPIMDEQHHHIWASEVIRGQGAEYIPFYRAPGYPYLLAAAYSVAGSKVPIGRLASSILGAATVALLFLVGLRVARTGAALVAALILAFYPMALYFDGMLLGASLETLLFIGILLALLVTMDAQGRGTVGASVVLGLVLGLATITRPLMAVLLPVVLVFLVIQYPRRWRAAAITSLTWAIPVVAVTVANVVLGKDWVLVAWNGGINFFLGNNPHANGWSATAPELRPSWWLGYADAIQIASRDLGHEASPPEVSAYWYNRGLDFVTHHPWAWLALIARKFYLLVNSLEFSNNQSIQAFREYSPLFRIPLLGFAAVATLAIPQLASRRPWRGPLPWFLLVYALALVFFFVTSRYRMPLIPPMILLATCTVADAVEAVRSGSWGRIAKVGVIAAALGLVSTSDWAGARDPNVAEQRFNLGNRYAAAGESEKAIIEYKHAIQLRPYHMGAWNNIGTVCMRQGRFEDACDVLEQSIQLKPTPEAYARLGMAYMQGKRYDLAREELSRALAIQPDNPEALYYLGHVVLAEEKATEAIDYWERAVRLHPDPSYRDHLYYALGKLYLDSGGNPARAEYLLDRVMKPLPGLEELRRRSREGQGQ